jgi:RNA polymerase sigma-70 factor (ECF subfamily)
MPPSIDADYSRRRHQESGAASWGVSPERFERALAASLAHRFDGALPADHGRAYLDSLHAADLGLACACVDGNDTAWEHFIRQLRPQLYHAARTIAGDNGRELADSLYAELFGLPGADGTRRSLLAYYHGRSRLLTWLRSVLVQRQIDRHRAGQRLTSLEDDDRVSGKAARSADPIDPDRDRLVGLTQQALDAAIDGLDPSDRLRLRLYYGQDMTLAAIGRVTGEHEATVSRKLEKARRLLERRVAVALAERGLDEGARARAFELAAEAPDLQLDRLLARAEDG